MNGVTNEKIEQFVSLVLGMKPAEWSRLKIAVDKEFDSMSNRLVLNDTESLKRKIEIEFKC
ncbi:hypothetical protein V6C27_02730 [Peptococcaceae bacterium 1198_IL3148]